MTLWPSRNDGMRIPFLCSWVASGNSRIPKQLEVTEPNKSSAFRSFSIFIDWIRNAHSSPDLFWMGKKPRSFFKMLSFLSHAKGINSILLLNSYPVFSQPFLSPLISTARYWVCLYGKLPVIIFIQKQIQLDNLLSVTKYKDLSAVKGPRTVKTPFTTLPR